MRKCVGQQNRMWQIIFTMFTPGVLSDLIRFVVLQRHHELWRSHCNLIELIDVYCSFFFLFPIFFLVYSWVADFSRVYLQRGCKHRRPGHGVLWFVERKASMLHLWHLCQQNMLPAVFFPHCCFVCNWYM